MNNNKLLEEIVTKLGKINSLKWEKKYTKNNIYQKYSISIKSIDFNVAKLNPKEYELEIWGDAYDGVYFFQGKSIGRLYRKLDKELGESAPENTLLKNVLEYIQE